MQRDAYVIRAVRALAAMVVAASALVVSSAAEAPPAHRTFASAEAAVRALAAAVESGDLVAQAAEEGRPLTEPSDPPTPFHGYYFKILTGQGAAVAGGARGYVVDGELSGGFALVAWPAQYDATGIMTFVVNHDGLIRQKDLGADTDAVARAMDVYNPDAAWHIVR